MKILLIGIGVGARSLPQPDIPGTGRDAPSMAHPGRSGKKVVLHASATAVSHLRQTLLGRPVATIESISERSFYFTSGRTERHDG
jgi:hypothetical protein